MKKSNLNFTLSLSILTFALLRSSSAVSAFPISMRGAAPETAVEIIELTIPEGSPSSDVAINAFDADQASEGNFSINNDPNCTFSLFGDQGMGANDNLNVDITFNIPITCWNNGANTVVFNHTATAGFDINSFNVNFAGAPIAPPPPPPPASGNQAARDKAFHLHQAIAGVTPNPFIHNTMENLINQGDLIGAAELATDSKHYFNVTLKKIFTPLIDLNSDTLRPLDDSIATLIGIARDSANGSVPFDEILYGNHLYIGQNITPSFSNGSNEHYEAIENSGLDLGSVLTRVDQTPLTSIPAQATSGILTLRGYGETNFDRGTNRRHIQEVFKSFLCLDLEQVADANLPGIYIRRDVERMPGGDPNAFTGCKGCHAHMDAQANAFSFFDYIDGKLIYGNEVKASINLNNFFPDGFIVSNDNWVNSQVTGVANFMGFSNAPMTGQGPKDWGKMIAKTSQFGTCMANRVFTNICGRKPLASEKLLMRTEGNFFKNNGYNFKELLKRIAITPECTGE